ncbi:MAG: mechanosensitive ion channel family protein [Gammaproteobacteria bacterium]|uniref:mechanosensitive ion channel family protein n=1 Tax=Pseudomaricurvus alcaniphilus TaxID=1166482 RepID=UPI00140CF370|nr:mechanosensitive ion channel family protein [Pseudomaricurvus alcaniphilus]MBR9909767.1 mechanosensitive ion channel family protein [Gammaproteobacteria bacterium]NHN38486.1 mechanosensitive ion channel family protein [Pseudomaricurvus alcaniphilus]
MNEVVTDHSVQDAITWAAILKAMVIVIAGWYLSGLLSRTFRRSSEEKLTVHQLAIYGRLVFYGVFALFVVTAIHQLGFKISVLLGAAGILSVAIGFASQTSASNLISGLFLLGEKSFEVGDVLRVGSDVGEVISIDLLSVKLRTFDNLFVRIPNEAMIKGTVVNLTKFPIRRADLTVGIAYREDVRQVTELLLDIADREIRVLEEPQPFCITTNFGSSSVDLQLSVWCRREFFRELKSELMMAIKEEFDQRGIEIPFPHVSLYSGSQTEPFPVQRVEEGRP